MAAPVRSNDLRKVFVSSALRELLDICAAHNVEPAKAYTTFEIYQELSLVRKLSNLKYFFNEELRTFYLSGKEETTDNTENVYIPVMYDDEITPQEMITIQEALSPEKKQFYLFIRDRDSSSTCYCITKGLVKPDSPDTCKKKKEIEVKKYHFEKALQANRKIFYTKALKKEKSEGSKTGKMD